MGIEEVDRLLGIFQGLAWKTEEEKGVIPDTSLSAFLEDTAHVFQLGSFDHVIQ